MTWGLAFVLGGLSAAIAVAAFWIGMKVGVWATVNVLAEASPAKRMAVFAKWLAQRRAR